MEQGHAPDATSKICYAMFYAAKALLAADGINIDKHLAVEFAFSYHFAKPGRIDTKYHKILMNAQKIGKLPIMTSMRGSSNRLLL